MEPVSDLHAAALRFARAGIPIFPCIADRKEPACANGFHDATTDEAQITEWWTADPSLNVAFSPHQVGLGIIDIDGEAGEESWSNWQITNGLQPDTYTVRTPRGGRHLYFRGILPATQSKLGPHVDTRGVGSYALVPPSVVDGKPYTVEDDREAEPLDAAVPDFLERLKRDRVKAASADLDRPQNIARAERLLRDYVARGIVAVEGQMGDHRTFVTACEVMNLGLSADRTHELLCELWNPSCVPEWDEDELRTKVENAAAYAQNEAGAWAVETTEDVFGAALSKLPADGAREREAGGAADRSRVIPVSFRDVLLRTVAPVAELVQGLVERGTVTFFAGPGGVHKSHVGVQWGLCIDSGAPIFGRATERATFVYLSYEDHPDEVARRVQTITDKLSLSGGSGVYFDLSGRDAPLAVVNESGEVETQPFYAEFVAALHAIPGHSFVVIDGTYNALRFAGSAKINEGAVMAGIALLQRLCLEADCTILCLWHPSQAGQERGDASGWSVAWHNAPRARLSLSAVKDREDAFELKVEKRNHGPKGQPVTLYWSDGVLLPRTEVSTTDQRSRFLTACVTVAEDAARSGQPIRKQHRLNTWMLDQIETACGYRPPEREVKEALAKALHEQRLRYVSHTRHRDAGYYPFDLDVAAELARNAKHLRVVGGTDV